MPELKKNSQKWIVRSAFSLLIGSVVSGYVWLFFTATSPPLPSVARPLYFYSNQSRQDIKLTFCSAINQAQHAIYLMMYGITDTEIINLLSKKADQNLGMCVYYDKKASANLEKKLPRSAQAFPFLSKGLMHRKILIIDNAQVFLGSANMTEASLKHHDNLVAGIFNPELAAFLQCGQGPYFSFEIRGSPSEIWLLPDRENKALLRLLESLSLAQEKIQIAMFTLTHPAIAEALIAAKERGVLVQVAVDYYTARGASQKTIQKLQQAGIALFLSRGQELLHHKWALIDEKSLVMGSANWTKAAFAKNEDFLLYFSHLANEHRTFLKNLWKVIEEESF